jgi:LysR family transcriptional regulator, nitrogen assimilation regulatory protein
VGAAGRRAGARDAAALTLKDLPRWPLVVPERAHAFRKLLDTQAALAGVKLAIAGEVSSVQSILELVRHGHGHAVLTRSAVLASDQPKQFAVRPLADAALKSTLCLAVSAHKPATPLVKQAARLLRELLVERVGVPARGSHNKNR